MSFDILDIPLTPPAPPSSLSPADVALLASRIYPGHWVWKNADGKIDSGAALVDVIVLLMLPGLYMLGLTPTTSSI